MSRKRRRKKTVPALAATSLKDITSTIKAPCAAPKLAISHTPCFFWICYVAFDSRNYLSYENRGLSTANPDNKQKFRSLLSRVKGYSGQGKTAAEAVCKVFETRDTSGHSFTTQLVLLCLIISLICHQNHLTCIFLIPTSTFIWCLCARLFGCEARWNPSISKPFISKLNFNIFFFKKGNNLLIQKPISPLHASEAITRGWVCSLPSAVPKTSRIATIAPSEGRLQYWHVRVIPWGPDHIRGWN